MVVLAGQPAVQHQRAVDLLDHPPFRLRDEALAPVVRVAADDLNVDVQQGAVDDDFVLEALVHQGLLQTHPTPLDRLVEQSGAGGVVVGRGGQHDDADDQPQNVYSQSSLAARHPFVGVQSCRGLRDTSGRADGLGVDDHEGRVLQSAGSLPHLAAQEFLDPPVEPVLAPQTEVVEHRRPGRQVVGQIAPLAARPVLTGDRVHDFPEVAGPGMSGRRPRHPTLLPDRDHQLDQCPLLVRQVARVRLSLHAPHLNMDMPSRRPARRSIPRTSDHEPRRIGLTVF